MQMLADAARGQVHDLAQHGFQPGGVDVPPGAASRPVLRVSLYERPVAPPTAGAPATASEEMAR